jgi:hypothetical protein
VPGPVLQMSSFSSRDSMLLLLLRFANHAGLTSAAAIGLLYHVNFCEMVPSVKQG